MSKVGVKRAWEPFGGLTLGIAGVSTGPSSKKLRDTVIPVASNENVQPQTPTAALDAIRLNSPGDEDFPFAGSALAKNPLLSKSLSKYFKNAPALQSPVAKSPKSGPVGAYALDTALVAASAAAPSSSSSASSTSIISSIASPTPALLPSTSSNTLQVSRRPRVRAREDDDDTENIHAAEPLTANTPLLPRVAPKKRQRIKEARKGRSSSFSSDEEDEEERYVTVPGLLDPDDDDRERVPPPAGPRLEKESYSKAEVQALLEERDSAMLEWNDVEVRSALAEQYASLTRFHANEIAARQRSQGVPDYYG